MASIDLLSTQLNEMQNHDDLEIVWLSLDNNVPNEQNIIDHLRKFNTFEDCNDYILSIQSERKILLVLINFFEYVSYYNSFPQIDRICVLKQNLQNMNSNNETYSKLIVFTDEHALIERLRQDIFLAYSNDFSINTSRLQKITVEESSISLDQNTLLFLWNHLFIYYLVNSPDVDMNRLKQDMVEQSRLEYQNDPKELIKINDFENNFSPNDAIKWYTKDSFIYRLVNKAFRTRNVDLICKFRYFIILLYNQLKELSIKQHGGDYTTVYRGQVLRKNELENLKSNIGNLISTNTIMSTTRNQDVARIYIRSDAEVNVIFEINTGGATNYLLHPFAELFEFSQFSEEEILFFAGAVFRIISVEQENKSTWFIKLTLTNETVEQIAQLRGGLQQKLSHAIRCWDHFFTKTDDIRLFSKYYRILKRKLTLKDIMTNVTSVNIFDIIGNLGNYEQAIEYYKTLLLNKQFIDDEKVIALNIIIGYNYFQLSQHDDALLYYSIAYSLLNDIKQVTGELYNHIGDVWKARNNFETALSYYQEALKIFTNHGVANRYFARIYRKMSDIYQQTNNYEDARTYEGKANQIDEHYREGSESDPEKSLKVYENRLNTQLDLPPQQRGDLLYSIGVCLIKKHQYSEALEKFLQAKTLFENDKLSANDFVYKFGTLYQCIALVYFFLNDNMNALIMWKKAIDVQTNLVSSFEQFLY